MSGNVRITLVTRDSLLDGTPVHVQIIDALHQQVRTEIARVGVPRQLELPEGAYAVRVLLPSGNVVESGFLIPAHSTPDPVAIDLASQLPHPWLEPTAVLGPSDQAGFDDLTRPAFATAWVRLWACRGSTWNVVPWPHPQVLRSAHGVRFTFHGLDVVPHAVQVGTASTPWHITLLPLSTAPLVTVRPAVRPEHLRVSVLTAETAVDALLGYGAVGDTRAAELIANSFARDPSAVLTHLGSIGLGYHLLNSSSGGGPSPEMLLGAAGTPDGAVLSAWVLLERMRSGSTKQSVEQVCLAFLRAAATGLPSLAQGLVRLIDGLRLAASSHTPYREDARSVLAEYARYLAHTDMTSPLLAFHGSRPDTPGQWNPGTAEIPYGAVLLTSPSPRESPTASVSAMLPGDLVLRAISTLDMGLEWRMPATRWTEASEIVDTLKQALAGSDWPVLADATETLRRLFSLRGNAVGSVRAPEWIGPPMRELLGRCSVLCGRSLELPRPAPTVGPTALPQTAAAGPSEETEGPSTPDNDSVVSLYATAVDAQDAALLETCISQFRQLLDTVQGGDPLRATVLVNYAIALWTLNEWTDEVSPQGDPARSLAEAASLSPPGTETFHRRVSCLHAVRTMRLQGRESVRTDTTTTGLAKVLVPETAERPGEPLELQIKTAEPTQDVPPRRTLRSSPRPQRVRKAAKALPRYDYEHYSRLAGPLTQPSTDRPYRVRYRSLLAMEPHRIRVALLLVAAPLLGFTVLAWLLQPEHWWPALQDEASRPLRITMIVAIGLIEFIRLVPLCAGSLSALVARDPVPVVPESGTTVAFLTTFVPGKEPLDMLSATLEAAVRLRHRGVLHIWLLDEGDDPEAQLICQRLGVHHFSRKGVAKWNVTKGTHRAKTKHGNYNAWLDAHGDDYDFVASVDTDHIPLPNFLERMLGYFRDPDVAFVVSPQVYGNDDSAVARAAESQQFLFHALTQRAGNWFGAPMLVGTNNAFRVSTLRTIGGLRDSITEDLATGLDIHRTRNPATGRRWRSVYTPDILAVGEGPSNWTDYITQQLRWSRGTYETIFKQMPRALFSLSPGRLLHYTLTVSYYPLTAMNWVLGALSCSIFVLLGTGSVDIDTSVWLTLYGNAFALQCGFYIWNRRHNVSPHEPEGSSGLSGMLMSALAAPVYVRGLLDAVLRRHSKFVVTPKGDASSPDRLWTFSLHLPWTLLYLVLVVYAFFPGRINPVGAFWSGIGLVLSAMPVVWWLAERRRRTVVRRASGHGSRTSPDDPKDGPVIPEQPSPVPMEDAQSVPPTQHGRSKDPFDS